MKIFLPVVLAIGLAVFAFQQRQKISELEASLDESHAQISALQAQINQLKAAPKSNWMDSKMNDQPLDHNGLQMAH